MDNLHQIVSRVDDVLEKNKRTEVMFLIGTGSLFAVGIVAVIVALVSGQFAWSLPSAFSTLFLKWPIEHIRRIRRENIALALAPLLIRELPPAEAAKEIQKLLETLFKDSGQ